MTRSDLEAYIPGYPKPAAALDYLRVSVDYRV